MELNDILSGAEDQNRGRWFELLHPVTGAATGLRLLVAGPDSRVQAEALALMTDDLSEAADDQGRVSGSDRAECHRRLLARCILDWRVTEGGEPLPYSHDRAKRLLAVAWVKAQVDAFAANRAVYFWPADKGAADAAA